MEITNIYEIPAQEFNNKLASELEKMPDGSVKEKIKKKR